MTHDSPQLPEALLTRLRQQANPPAEIPPTLDAAIVQAGMATIARNRRWRLWVRVSVGLSAAACLAVVCSVWFISQHEPNLANNQAPTHPQRVTIAAAYHLARQRAAGDTSITQAQIDQLAMASVRLDQYGAGGAP